MLIKCPFCHAHAQIPSSKEGAKVRCSECGKVYRARDPKARRTSSTQGLSIGIFVGAAVVAAVAFFFLNRSKGAPLPVSVAARDSASTEPEEPAAPIDRSGWNAAPVQAVAALYAAAAEGDGAGVEARLAEAAAGDPRLERAFRPAFWAEGADEATPDLLADWKPYDGEVLSETDDEALVRIVVGGRAKAVAAEARQLDFRLVRVPDQPATSTDGWRVSDWERYFTPEEVRTAQPRGAAAGPAGATVERVVLSDGTAVREAEPGPIEHLDSTPDAQRAAIDAAYARMVDFSLRPKENAAALAELVEVGKPALPVLLTGLYELPLETDDDAARVNLVNQALEDITGHQTGFSPRLDAESTLGTTAERRTSALRQWFAWWHLEGERFEGLEPSADPLEALIEPTERDLRQMERDRR